MLVKDHNLTSLEHPLYSPGLSPAGCYLFSCLTKKIDDMVTETIKHPKEVSENGLQESLRQPFVKAEKKKNYLKAFQMAKLFSVYRSFKVD